MATPILMPRPGQMTEECTLQSWLKQEGDPVHKGDVLFEIETDKSNMEIETFEEGVLLRILVPEGATVPVNTLLAWIGQAGEAIPDAHEEPAAPTLRLPRPPRPADPRAGRARPHRIGPRRVPARGSSATGHQPPGQPARRGAGGRPAVGDRHRTRRPHRGARHPGRRRAAARRARRRPGTRARRPPAARRPRPVQSDPDAPAPEPLSRLRQVIAQRLTECVTTIPHFTVTVAVDMTGLVGAARRSCVATAPRSASRTSSMPPSRRRWSSSRSSTPAPTAVSSGAASASTWASRSAVPGGLVVPVIRDADRRTPGRPPRHRRARSSSGARAGKLGPDDLSGQHVHDQQHGHVRRGAVHRDRQPGRIRHPRGVQHPAHRRGRRRRPRGAPGDAPDAHPPTTAWWTASWARGSSTPCGAAWRMSATGGTRPPPTDGGPAPRPVRSRRRSRCRRPCPR